MTAKTRFVQDFVIRLSPEPARARDAVARALAVWAELEALGYGEDYPPAEPSTPPQPSPARGEGVKGCWDGLPPARVLQESWHPSFQKGPQPQPSLQQQRQAAAGEVAHFRRLANLNPECEEWQTILAQAEAKWQALKA